MGEKKPSTYSSVYDDARDRQHAMKLIDPLYFFFFFIDSLFFWQFALQSDPRLVVGRLVGRRRLPRRAARPQFVRERVSVRWTGHDCHWVGDSVRRHRRKGIQNGRVAAHWPVTDR